jgi:adenosine kinase
MNIIVTGSLAFDQIMLFPDAFVDNIMPDKLHVLSVSFLVEHLHKNYGGTAGNICYTLGLLGKSPICLSTAGKDAHDYKSFLEKDGINTHFMKLVHDDYTGHFVVITDKKDCQIAGFYPGAMAKDKDLSIKAVMEELHLPPEDTFVVLAPTSPEAMRGFITECHELQLRYLYSPAQQIAQTPKEDLVKGIEKAEVIIGNDYEIALLESRAEMSKQDMLKTTKIIISTLGDRGSVIEQAGKDEIVVGVAKPHAVHDPTGSGDAYIAGFLAAYLDGRSVLECGQRAATAAVYAVEQYGTTTHSFSLNIFENRLKENFG